MFEGGEPCFKELKKTCTHNINDVNLTELNPKLPNSGTECGGFAKKSARLMVTTGMAVTPLSAISGFDIINELNAPISSVIEKEVYGLIFFLGFMS